MISNASSRVGLGEGFQERRAAYEKNRRAAFDAEGKVAANLNAWSDK